MAYRTFPGNIVKFQEQNPEAFRLFAHVKRLEIEGAR